MKLQSDRKIKILISDNERVYKSDLFLLLYRDEGIKRHLIVRETLQQNGVVEKLSRTLLEKI